jgi:hypothetical protein
MATELSTAERQQANGQVVRMILGGLPLRVLIDEEGRTVSGEVAQATGQQWRRVLIRRDGWTLGFPLGLEDVAFEMWRGEWAGCWCCRSGSFVQFWRT